MTTTATQRLVDAVLDGQLREYVAGRRAAGRSWRQAALDLYRDHEVEVSHETLRSWYPDLDRPDGARAVS